MLLSADDDLTLSVYNAEPGWCGARQPKGAPWKP
jgi:hypothetical protein